jgi:mono/diheme cytochrome c family protein
MNMSRTVWIRIVLAVVIALAALFLIRMHNAGGAQSSSAAAGHRLAEAWCKECHAIEAATIGAARPGPDFVMVANQLSTTALSLRVFLQTSHRSMPNLILKPDETDNLINYILSLKRN